MTRGRTTAAVVVAIVVAALLWLVVGVEEVFAVAWGVLAGVVVLCSQLVIPDDARTDAVVLPSGPEKRGTAVARMAWSINPRTGAVGDIITRRVRGILRHRLLRRGLDTEDPADRAQIDALIGAGLWDRLTGQGTHRTDIERALDAIDRLSPTKEKQ